jgi:hypothetical protein
MNRIFLPVLSLVVVACVRMPTMTVVETDGGPGATPGGGDPKTGTDGGAPVGSGDGCEAAEPPLNPFLPNSAWPTIHRNNANQASTCLRGPEPGDTLEITTTPLPGQQSASSWLFWSDAYPDGTRALYGGSVNFLLKAVPSPTGFELVEKRPTNADALDLSRLTHIALSNHRRVSTAGREILFWKDVDESSPKSATVIEHTVQVPSELGGIAAFLAVMFDGSIAFITSENGFGVVSKDRSTVSALKVSLEPDEVAAHNQFAVDAQGNLYIVTTHRMLSLRWDGMKLTQRWQAPYDFVGNGPKGIMRGSGTTPTLIGFGPTDDRLVFVVDGHTPSNLVTFWRDDIPGDWKGLDGQDRRMAALTPLPFAAFNASVPFLKDKFQAVENSPTARGYEIALAQYNGFFSACNPEPGVQKLRWNPSDRTMRVIWATDKVNLNSVLTYSAGSKLVYGSGRKDCKYFFYGLDWETGEVRLEVPLGMGNAFNDQGNQVVIGEGRDISFSGATSIVHIRPK